MQIKKSRQIDGVSFIFSSAEFEVLANALRKINLSESHPDMKKALQVLESYSYFDLEKKEVHTNFGYRELGGAMIALMVANDYAENSIFDELSSREDARIWKNYG